MLSGIKQILPHKLFCGQSQNAIASCTASLDRVFDPRSSTFNTRERVFDPRSSTFDTH
ncbi:hypothetical protein [Nostoc sp.]|uniref:hypothetical protein n=1 Tax=Nostoc sp. TaxID=1180 RepID=UPI002FFCF804